MSEKKVWMCPVCGYGDLPEPPEDWTICPCCSTMFEYSDKNWGEDELRKEWIDAGMKWWSDHNDCPENFSPRTQLFNLLPDVDCTCKTVGVDASCARSIIYATMNMKSE